MNTVANISAASSDVAPQPRAPHIRSARSAIYAFAGILASIIALIGFWPTYFGPFFLGTLKATVLVHTHAAVQVAWLALFIAQIVMAISGRLAWHVKLGKWVMLFSIVVIYFGLVVSFDVFGRDVAMGEVARGQRRLFGFLREVVFFVPFIVAGWIYRHQPEIHKRLMVVAMVILLVPAVGRMKFLGEPPSLWQFMLVWPLPVYLMMTYDYAKAKLIHPVYLIGVAAMLAERLVLPLRTSETWMAISAWFVPFYQSPISGN